MTDYSAGFEIDAAPATVYAALATVEGVRGWWTRDCEGRADTGGTFRIAFGRTHKTLRVEQLMPEREVRWRVTKAHIAAAQLSRPDEWVGTQIVFRLAPLPGGRTRLDFEHVGLVPGLQCHGLCVDGWQYFLASLQRFAATGTGTPYVPQRAAAQ
jgi:uncharacterized protein YndB with AHSA1/START domain